MKTSLVDVELKDGRVQLSEWVVMYTCTFERVVLVEDESAGEHLMITACKFVGCDLTGVDASRFRLCILMDCQLPTGRLHEDNTVYPAASAVNVPDQVCPKCGHEDVGMRWCVETWHRGSYDGEHFHRTCRRCHYEWLTADVLSPAPTGV